jgi:hypothetical protein
LWEIDFQARPETDQAEPLSSTDAVSFPHPADDPSCNKARNLDHGELATPADVEAHSISFIVL